MEKSIVEQVIAIAKRKNEERLASFKEKLLQDFEKHFHERAMALNNWLATDKSPYTFDGEKFNSYNINLTDFLTVCKSLGFCVTWSARMGLFSIYIPEYRDNQEKTPAQILLEQFDKDLSEAIKKEEEKAMKLCAEVFKRLCQGDFKVLDAFDERHNIEIIVDHFQLNYYFETKLREILKEHGFSVSIDGYIWKLTILMD